MRCRLCIKDCEASNCTSLFYNGEPTNSQLRKLMVKYFHLEIKQNDSYSTIICLRCVQKLEDFHQYCQYIEEQQLSLCKAILPIATEELEEYRPVIFNVKAEIIESQAETNTFLNELFPNYVDSTNCNLLNKVADEQNRHEVNITEDEIIEKHIQLICNICGVLFKKFCDLKSHFRVHNIAKGYAFCCNKKFVYPNQLLEHAKHHQNPYIFKYDSSGGLKLQTYSEHRGIIPNICADENSNDENPMELEVDMESDANPEKNILNRTCGVCGKIFNYLLSLKVHMCRKHKNSKPFKCGKCGKRFSLRASYERHQKQILSCYKKLKMQRRIPNIERSSRQSSLCPGTDAGEIITKDCQPSTWMQDKQNYSLIQPAPQSLQQQPHIERELDEKYRCCVICNLTHISVNALRMHMQRHHKNVKPFSCSICGQEFILRKSLDKHTSTAHTSPDETINNAEGIDLIKGITVVHASVSNCMVNNEDFPESSNACKETYIDSHVKIKEELEEFVIEEVDVDVFAKDADQSFESTFHTPNSFNENREMQSNIQTCTLKTDQNDSNELQYRFGESNTTIPPIEKTELKYRICPICHKTQLSLSTLRVHMYRKHKDILPFSCIKCGTEFRLQHTFDRHRKSCKKTKNDILRQQENEENNIKYRTCSICHMTSTTPAGLRTHMNRYHKNILPFGCSTCGEQFRLAQTFERHIMTCSKNKGHQSSSEAFVEKTHFLKEDELAVTSTQQQSSHAMLKKTNSINEEMLDAISNQQQSGPATLEDTNMLKEEELEFNLTY